MRTIVLHVPDEDNEAAVLAALRELQQRMSFYLESETGQLPGCNWSADAIENEILQAQQGPTISLAEARQRFSA